MPKVSVIIPTYNRAKYISEAIDSVLSQTFQDFEIIVIDDGSTDDTREVLKKYSHKIKYIYQENEGAGAARNTGIKDSKGDYIAFLDSDDLWIHEKLELQVKLLDENKDVGLVYSNVYYFTNIKKMDYDYFKVVKPYSGFVLEPLFMKDFIPCQTVVARKECFEKVGLFDSAILSAQDYDMWLRIANYFKIDFVNKPLAKYRVHSDRITANHSCIKKQREGLKLLYKVLDYCPDLRNKLGRIVDKRFASIYFLLGCGCLCENELLESRKAFLRSIRCYPYNLRKYIFLFFTFLPRGFRKILSPLFCDI